MKFLSGGIWYNVFMRDAKKDAGKKLREFEEPLAQVFEERKREVEKMKIMWQNLFLLNILLLFGSALFIFVQLTVMGVGLGLASWLQFAITLPLIYSAIFFHAQHSRAREYLEEYSFKSLVARSLKAYRNFLKGEISRQKPEEQKKYLDFLVAAVKELYTPPRKIISKNAVKDEEDIKVGVVEKLGDIFKRFIPGK